MLLLSTKSTKGINPFYPFFTGVKNTTLRVLNWDQYQKVVPYYVLINSVFATILSLLLLNKSILKQEIVYLSLSILQMLYLFLRFKYGRQVINIEITTTTIVQTAPTLVWIDYMSLGGMLVLSARLGHEVIDFEPLNATFKLIEVFFTVYSFLPCINYIYSKMKKRPF